jgi:glycogen(starch) synthase
MEVLIIGPHPPYLGGIAIHNQRYAQWLGAHGVEVKILDLYYRGHEKQPDIVIDLPSMGILRLQKIIAVARKTPPDTIVHLHIAMLNKFKWIAPILVGLFRRQSKVITLHAGELAHENHSFLFRKYLHWLFRRFEHIIPVNDEISAFLTETIGIPREDITVIPAYIHQMADQSLLPNQIAQLAGKKTLVITSGSLNPLYNYEPLIECIKELDKSKYAFIFAFYFEGNPEYKTTILGLLESLENVITFQGLQPETYLSIVSACDIYVRTTKNDGDSLAIREAVDLGLTVFAGDTVWRPPECELFSLTDSASLLGLFKKYEQNASVKEQASLIRTGQTNADRLFQVYERVSHN